MELVLVVVILDDADFRPGTVYPSGFTKDTTEFILCAESKNTSLDIILE